jgi:leucyl aminopeptidase (aminopeptidase T)
MIWEQKGGEMSMIDMYYEYELGKASDILARELFKLKPGETFVITADTESDPRVVNATARAAFAIGVKPMVIWLASPLGVGKAADPMLPVEALTAVLKAADAWVEYNNQWLLYSTPYDEAMKANEKLRHLCLVGMNVDMMVRCVARVNYEVLGAFQRKCYELTKRAKHIRITTPAGGHVEFNNPKNWFDITPLATGYADTPGSHMMAGQISWTMDLETVNGIIVFDGSLVPPCGKLEQPIRLTLEKGAVVKIDGGSQAKQFEVWVRAFNHPQMLRVAHMAWGFNPGARLTGNIVEDERVWGASEWGMGRISAYHFPPEGIPAPSHLDGICLNSSAWLDGEQLLDQGKIVHKELLGLAKELGKA